MAHPAGGEAVTSWSVEFELTEEIVSLTSYDGEVKQEGKKFVLSNKSWNGDSTDQVENELITLCTEKTEAFCFESQ